MRRAFKLPANTTIKIVDNTADPRTKKALDDFRQNFIEADAQIVPSDADAKMTFEFRYDKKNNPLNLSTVAILKKEKNHLIFHANSSSAMNHLIYSYLERHWKDTWYYPEQNGHIFHKRVIDPFFRTRVRWEYHLPFLLATQQWGESKDWHRRMREITDRDIIVLHNWHRMISPKKYFEKHPEYFALIDGKREPKQLCTSNPEVIKKYATAVKNYFKKHPDATVFSFSPEDGYSFCECNHCRALDVESGSITDRLIVFFNAVIDEVHIEYPDKKGAFYAYLNYTEPPVNVTPHTGLIPVICHTPWEFCHNHAITDPNYTNNQRFKKIVEQWVRICPEVYIREYYGHFLWFGYWPILHSIEKDIAFYRSIGIKGVISESHEHWGVAGWVLYGAGLYLAGDTRPWQDIIKQYSMDLFPSSFQWFNQFLNMLENKSAEVGCRRIDLIFDRKFILKLKNALNRISRTARTEEEHNRVAMYQAGLSISEQLANIARARSQGNIEQMIHLTSTALKWIDETEKSIKPPNVIKYSLAKKVLKKHFLDRFKQEKQNLIDIFKTNFDIELSVIPTPLPARKWMVSRVYKNTVSKADHIPMYPPILQSNMVTGLDTVYDPEKMNVRWSRAVYDNDSFTLYEYFPFRPNSIKYYRKRFILDKTVTGILGIRAIDGYKLVIDGNTIAKVVLRRFEKEHLFDYYPIELDKGMHIIMLKLEASRELKLDDFTVLLFDNDSTPIQID